MGLVVHWSVMTYGILLILLSVSGGLGDIYSNTFISPNSADDNFAEISTPKLIDATKFVYNEQEGSSLMNDDEKSPDFTSIESRRVQRSADPILTSTAAEDKLLLFKNVDDSLDSNDVEMSGRIGHYIQPSKTGKNHYFGSVQATADPNSGEGLGALQGRSLQEPQEIQPSATTTPAIATASDKPERPRQANPDIQDIITGLVKLLNGNVNVHANTALEMGRPIRPISTRINNRGPPRITDVPPLPPDFNLPAPPKLPPTGSMPMPVSTRPPAPYPFEIPPPNVSPKRPYPGNPGSSEVNGRPGFYKPITPPPWNRRRPTKRPNPYIPPYKPMPSMPDAEPSEAPMEDILTLDLGSHLENSEDEGDVSDNDKLGENNKQTSDTINPDATDKLVPDPSIDTELPEQIDKENEQFEKNKEKNPKPDKSSKITIVTPTMKTETSILETPIVLVTETSTSTQSSEDKAITPTSVSTEVVEVTQTLNDNISLSVNSSSTTGLLEVHDNNIPTLESSMPEVLPTVTDSSTSTTVLPTGTLHTTETAMQTDNVTESTKSGTNLTSSTSFPYYPYRPRPGIVLDDTEYKPGGANRQPIVTRPPSGGIGDIFDVTVSAIQGPGGHPPGQGQPYVIPVDIESLNGQGDVITSPIGSEGFVSIDGKRTYLNLFGDNPEPTGTVGVKPSSPSSNQVVQGTAYVAQDKPAKPNLGSVKPAQRRPTFGRPRPSQPPVRIDTCIVGDDSTCDVSQHEICRTESGVSACHCRPGTARRKHRDPCRKIVSVLLSLRVDRIYERRVVWADELLEKNSESYGQLSYEAERALESAMSMTPFSDEYLGSKVNNIYRGDRSQGQGGVFVNITLQLEENADTARPSVRGDIQKHLLGVIQRRSNNVGNSALWVDSPPGAVSSLQDLDECSSPELHDCHSQATCINTFGSFKCECNNGLRDPWSDNKHRAGRYCEQCSASRCNNRGECKYQNGQEVCVCTGNYYGNQCELDGEVLGVAIGASVAAIIIIGLTLVCLVMWSRKWSREQKAAVGSPVFGYMATVSNTVKTPVVGAPPYQLTLEDRLRWAQIADVMAQANHYAPEPGLAPTRPSSALFGYPTLPVNNTLQRHPGSICGGGTGTLPPVPLPRLNLQAQMASRAASMKPDNSSSSEEEDKIDLLGRNFHVPRPKSRSNASIANQSGIYYDVDYDQNDLYKPSGIPMSTYGRGPFFRN
ncbi:calcium-binding EGF-like domain-containing protein pawn isoform X2 [Rhynchophorus ferrugineus]|uniref:calcium-binding EGF-like domain-containing protein pawn isoform X2 n=1 Tax=Rhynchophorus ferrugineus TaxID=354439 RepID=UPI003FCED501